MILNILDHGEPSHPAIIVPGGPALTYAELREQVDALAGQLRSSASAVASGSRSLCATVSK
jgi:hypothetical protein